RRHGRGSRAAGRRPERGAGRGPRLDRGAGHADRRKGGVGRVTGFTTILFERREDVAWVTLNRPEVLNAYDTRMRDDLYAAFGTIRDDPSIRAVVLRGAGRAFCAGGDIREFGSAPSPVVAREVRWRRDVWGLLRSLAPPTIAAVHGHA